MLYPRRLGKNSTQSMEEYCKNTTECRHKLLNKNFPGEGQEVNPMHLCCDICTCKCGGETCQADLQLIRSEAEKCLLQCGMMPAKSDRLGNKQCFLNEEAKKLVHSKLVELTTGVIYGIRNYGFWESGTAELWNHGIRNCGITELHHRYKLRNTNSWNIIK